MRTAFASPTQTGSETLPGRRRSASRVPGIRTAVGHADGVGAGPVTRAVLRLDGERRGGVPLPTDADQVGVPVDDLGPAGVDGAVRRGHRLAGDLRGRWGSRRAGDPHRRQHHEGETEERAEGRDDEERAAPHGRRSYRPSLPGVARLRAVYGAAPERSASLRISIRGASERISPPSDAPERPSDRELRRRRARTRRIDGWSRSASSSWPSPGSPCACGCCTPTPACSTRTRACPGSWRATSSTATSPPSTGASSTADRWRCSSTRSRSSSAGAHGSR